MATFKAFKPEAMQRIARSMGYSGDMNQFQSFLAQNPDKNQQMNNYNMKAMQMARGGVVKMQEGGDAGAEDQQENQPATDENTQDIMDYTGDQITQPVAPVGGTVDATKIDTKDDQVIDEGIGQVGDAPKVEAKTGETKEITDVPKVEVETVDPTKVGDASLFTD